MNETLHHPPAIPEYKALVRSGIRRPTNDVQRRSWYQVQADTGATSGLWVLDDGTECDCRADPSEAYASDPDHGRRVRCRDAGTMG